MILILSKNQGEASTDIVMSWLFYFNFNNVIRINGEDLIDEEFELSIGEEGTTFFFRGNEIKANDVNVVWFRRTYDLDIINNLFSEKDKLSYDNKKNLELHLRSELSTIYKYFEIYFNNAFWLNKYTQNLNKLNVLYLAMNLGIKIPDTRIINNRKCLIQFFEKHQKLNQKIITKPLNEVTSYDIKGKIYKLLTKEIEKCEITKSQNEKIFFPSKVQEYVNKFFEVRSFFLNNTFYSMAIFSKDNEKTKFDYRNYDEKLPNRRVPYNLPSDFSKKLLKLIKILGLESCSIDIIVDINLTHYFLEINPVGQFGMISYPCNYNLEKKIANFILKKNNDKEKKQITTFSSGS